MIEFSNKCFVCNSELTDLSFSVNMGTNLPVCDKCKGTNEEKEAVAKIIEGLADGFVCGCI